MRRSAVFLAAILAVLGSSAGAEVLRCVDAGGKVVYTDGNCPAGTKPQRKVSTQEPISVLPDPAGAARERDAQQGGGKNPTPRAPPAQPQPGASSSPSGAVIIDGRGTPPESRSDAERWDGGLGADPQVAEGYYYPNPYPYAGGGRPPPPPPRPLPRKCDPATGCTDRMGNNYNQNTGKLQRYQSIDGKTCNPVGTTVVCR